MWDAQFLLLFIIQALISIIVLYIIIRVATKSKSIYHEQVRQSMYLEAIAKKQGVTDEELLAIDKEIDRL